jgi:hypothetical protein
MLEFVSDAIKMKEHRALGLASILPVPVPRTGQKKQAGW